MGTNAGGTPEIVDDDVEGMLHPVGVDGIPVLAQHCNIEGEDGFKCKSQGPKILYERKNVRKSFKRFFWLNKECSWNVPELFVYSVYYRVLLKKTLLNSVIEKITLQGSRSEAMKLILMSTIERSMMYLWMGSIDRGSQIFSGIIPDQFERQIV